MSDIFLGDKVKDTVSGIVGIAIGRTERLRSHHRAAGRQE